MHRHSARNTAAFVLLSFATLFMGTTCRTNLDPAGVYQGDAVLYRMESTIPAAKKTLDELVKFEYNNRALLAQWPEVKNIADDIRRHAPGWFEAANVAHDQYVEAKNALLAAREEAARAAAAANLDAKTAALNEKIAVINAAVDIATRLLVQHQLEKATP